MRVFKSIGLFLLVSLYSLGGLNHFLSANVYLQIMPAYLPFPKELVVISGFVEILLAALLLLPVTRKLAGWTIGLMLIAFLPVHIQMIVDAPVRIGVITVTPALAWIRLALQPVLVAWVIWNTW
ncbi:MAG TPA: hypothetical protein VN939_12685 [Chthoniobacterales bacterium]|jgi:uncharacterized membrane protein|nr:hypothetical protein [Chthoniobacterales bacterium]